jgi:hypothetical protein
LFSDPVFFKYYNSSPIYVVPVQGSLFRDKAYKGGFYLRGLRFIVPPIVYDASHRYGWLETTMNVYSALGRMMRRPI